MSTKKEIFSVRNISFQTVRSPWLIRFDGMCN